MKQGLKPAHAIADARYTIDTPPWQAGATFIPMTAGDGAFNSVSERVVATINTTGLAAGRHIVYVQGRDAQGNWGPVGATFLTIEGPVTPTPTLTATPPTPPTPSPTPDYSPTPPPTATPTEPIIVIIGTPIENLETPEPTETNVAGGFTFMRQSDPQAISINLYDASRGCGWMGVAGRVVDEQNRPVTGIRVWLRGTLDGKRVDMTSLTGTAAQYGPSGYEFTIANQPIASRGSLSVRLLDQANLPLSERVVFDTFADCDKNLILIDFKKVR
jgi:hypothetical protein